MQLTPGQLSDFLAKIVEKDLKDSLMIWGPPGVGKSSIVKAVANEDKRRFVDLRLSQLAPTDLRGLPGIVDNCSRWYPPSFLPVDGEGILFLDEINMAPPAMQGVAQQLILDRCIGDYQVPDGWFIWAAGNRREDKAAVFQMPSALANRFLHVTVQPDLDSFNRWGLQSGIAEEVLAFLEFRPVLLHKIHATEFAWPSPRSWVMADSLFKAGLPIAPAVGGVAAEFEAFLSVYDDLPDIDAIAAGNSKAKFPKEPSKRYAIVLALVVRADTAEKALNCLSWMASAASAEWLQLFVTMFFPVLRDKGFLRSVVAAAATDPELQTVVENVRDLVLTS
jgi:hypothetical protein